MKMYAKTNFMCIHSYVITVSMIYVSNFQTTLYNKKQRFCIDNKILSLFKCSVTRWPALLTSSSSKLAVFAKLNFYEFLQLIYYV